MHKEMIESLIKLQKAKGYEIEVLRKQHSEHMGEMPIHVYLNFATQMSKLKAVSRATATLISILVDID